MDLLRILRSKIDELPGGTYSAGLNSVLKHLETSVKHWSRGEDSYDYSAFTDAVYRANQAFEGSVKEAYRVLAGKNPTRKRPSEIEEYLRGNQILRPRVLDQFTRYRTEWRNPSAHEHDLEFDQSEAFLAITSVAAFACVLIDQMSEKVAKLRCERMFHSKRDELLRWFREEAGPEYSPVDFATDNKPIFQLIELMLLLFPRLESFPFDVKNKHQLAGAITGMFSACLAGIELVRDYPLVPNSPEFADLLVSRHDDKVLLHLAISRDPADAEKGVRVLRRQMRQSGIPQGVVFVCDPRDRDHTHQTRRSKVKGTSGKLLVIQPLNRGPNEWVGASPASGDV
jgi:hypothetical protein